MYFSRIKTFVYSNRKNFAIFIRTQNFITNKSCFHRKTLKRCINDNKLIYRNLIKRAYAKKQKTDVLNISSKKKVKLKRSDIFRLYQLAKSEKLILTGGIACLILSSGITMSVPYALGKILDIIFNNTNVGTLAETFQNLKHLCLWLGGIFIVGGLANFGRVYLFNTASLRIVKDLRTKLYTTMLNQETAWFDTKGSGELISRLSNDSYMVGNSLSQNLSDGLRSTFMIFAGTGMMIYTSPQLALISSCIVPCVAGTAIIYGRFLRNITTNLFDKYADIMKSAEERLGNIKTVKVFCKEDQEGQIFDNQLIDALNLGYKEVLAKASFYGLTGFTGNAIIISVLYYGGTLVISDELTIGALTSFILYAAYSAISINGFSSFYTELNKGIGSAHRIWRIFDRKYEISIIKGLKPIFKPKGEISFKNVKFSFPTRPNNLVINNVSIQLMPRTTTAIVGKSGSGKSTIATLLLRLYDPQEGSILLDEYDLKELNPCWLRSHIGVVPQEPILFSGSIRDNILYGLDPGTDISEQDLQNVIQKANVDEFLRKLPNGIETQVGQRGILLSGGQKQRIAIARALIKNPIILVLDEATSALDAVSEELVQNALDKLIKERTVLIIAHRLSTILNANKIIVLENGEIYEQGSYRNLIGNETGIFRDLVHKQTFQMPDNFNT